MGGFHAQGMAVSIRSATVADAIAIASVVVECWHDTYAGIIPDEYLIAMDVVDAAERWRRAIALGGVIVATVGGAVVGVGFHGGHSGTVGVFEGEVYALYVDVGMRGAGIGRALMAAMARRFLDDGCGRVFLWCLRDNPARWFYERLGGQIVAQRTERLAGVDLAELAYGWQDLGRLARETGDS